MTNPRIAVCLLALLFQAPAQAARIDVAIDPGSTDLTYKVFAFGVFPVQARFERFTGLLTADPADPGSCDVHVLIQVGSLRMEDPAHTAQALGPAMLDVARFPTMRFDGRCVGTGVSGALDLHGITRPLLLSERRFGSFVVCTATLRRQDFGVSGLPYLVGAKIIIRFTTRLPQAFAQHR